MHINDILPTIAPITDIISIDKQVGNNISGSSGNRELEFVCTSGYHQVSYLSFIKEGIPYDTRLLNKDLQNIKRVYTIRDYRQ